MQHCHANWLHRDILSIYQHSLCKCCFCYKFLLENGAGRDPAGFAGLFHIEISPRKNLSEFRAGLRDSVNFFVCWIFRDNPIPHSAKSNSPPISNFSLLLFFSTARALTTVVHCLAVHEHVQQQIYENELQSLDKAGIFAIDFPNQNLPADFFASNRTFALSKLRASSYWILPSARHSASSRWAQSGELFLLIVLIHFNSF
jgi:hypothetical protein